VIPGEDRVSDGVEVLICAFCGEVKAKTAGISPRRVTQTNTFKYFIFFCVLIVVKLFISGRYDKRCAINYNYSINKVISGIFQL